MIPETSSSSSSSSSQQQLAAALDHIRQGHAPATDEISNVLMRQAIWEESIEAILWLVYAGADVNAPLGANQPPPLLLAVQYKHWLAAETLLCLGADKNRSLAAIHRKTEDALYTDVQTLGIDVKVFKALWYWAVIHYHPRYASHLLAILQERIAFEPAIDDDDDEKKSLPPPSVLNQPLLTSNTPLSHVPIQELWSDFYCLADIATQSEQYSVRDYLHNLHRPGYSLDDQQLSERQAELQENYLRVLPPPLVQVELSPALASALRETEAVKISLPLAAKRPNDANPPRVPPAANAKKTIAQDIDTFMRQLEQELQRQPFWRERNSHPISASSKWGTLVFVLSLAVILPCLFENNHLADEAHTIQTWMAHTPYAAASPRQLLYCDSLFSPRNPYACRQGVDLRQCRDLCNALVEVGRKHFWYLALGIIAPSVIALITLPFVLMGLYQVSNMLSIGINRFDHLPLTQLSNEVQSQAQQLFTKISADHGFTHETLSLHSTVAETRSVLMHLQQHYATSHSLSGFDEHRPAAADPNPPIHHEEAAEQEEQKTPSLANW